MKGKSQTAITSRPLSLLQLLLQILLLTSIIHILQASGMEEPLAWTPDYAKIRGCSTVGQNTWQNSTCGYRTEVVKVVAEVCGLSRVCNHSGLDVTSFTVTPDCSPCDYCRCDDVCVTYGDCCVDKVIDDVIAKGSPILDTPVNTEESSYSSCSDVRVRQKRQDFLFRTRYVSKCPKNYHDTDVIRKCDNGSKTAYYDVTSVIRVEDLWNIWPVVSEKSKISYRNCACAQCHGEEDIRSAASSASLQLLRYWDLKISCRNDATMAAGLSKLEVVQLALDDPNCDVIFDLPEEEGTPSTPSGFSKRACIQMRDSDEDDILGKCNATGGLTITNGQIIDPVLQQACEKFPTVVIKESQTYANIFCVLCQTELPLFWRSLCRAEFPFSFFFVVSPRMIEETIARIKEEEEMRKKKKCLCAGEDQAFDPIKKTCRAVLCPQGFTLSRDQEKVGQDGGPNFRCVSDGTVSKGVSYSLNIELTSSQWTDSGSGLDDPMFPNIATQIQSLLVSNLQPVKPDDLRFNSLIVYHHHHHHHIPSTDQKDDNTLTKNFTIGLATRFVVLSSHQSSLIASKLTALAQKGWLLQLPATNNVQNGGVGDGSGGGGGGRFLLSPYAFIPSYTSPLVDELVTKATNIPNKVTSMQIMEDSTSTSASVSTSSSTVSPSEGRITFYNHVTSRPRYVLGYLEVKDTLSCPHFVLGENLAGENEDNEDENIDNDFVLLEENVNDDLNNKNTTTTTTNVALSSSSLPFKKKSYALKVNSTGLIVPYRRFYHDTRRGKYLVCAREILESWREWEKREREITLAAAAKAIEASFGGKELGIVSLVCLIVSCLCFTITLVTYALFPSLRNLPGKNNMALVSNMLLMMALCLFNPIVETYTVTCQIVGVATHFFLLVSVTWMTICTYRMYKVFTHIFHYAHDPKNSTRCFLKYLTFSVLLPATIIVLTMSINLALDNNDNNDDNNKNNTSNVLDNRNDGILEKKNTSRSPLGNLLHQTSGDDAIIPMTSQHQTLRENPENLNNKAMMMGANTATTNSTTRTLACGYGSNIGSDNDNASNSIAHIGYGDGVCYLSNELSVLLAAGVPIMMAVLFNAVLFVLTSLAVRKMNSDQVKVSKECRQQMWIYLKLCALNGLNWFPGLVSVFVDSIILWYAFVVLAGLQGIYVMAAFVLNTRILNLYRMKLRCCRNKAKARGSSSSSAIGDKTPRQQGTPANARLSLQTSSSGCTHDTGTDLQATASTSDVITSFK